MKRRSVLVPLVAAALIFTVVAGVIYLRFVRAVAVPVVQAVPEMVVLRVVGPGTVQARVPVTLSARITATVKQVGVDVGDVVKRDQVLVLLDDRDLTARRGVVGGQQTALSRNLVAAQATVSKAQAELDLARSKRRRDLELLGHGFVSQAVVDGSDAAMRSAEANLENARATLLARDGDSQALSQEARYADTVLSFTRITAPMDGVIISRQVEVGTTTAPGTALLRMVDPASLWVAMRVDESVVGKVQMGQSASIRLRTGEMMNGKVARISRQSDAATRELEVNVTFDVPLTRFAIDQEAEVTITAGEVKGLAVPLTALTRDKEGRRGVLVVKDSRAEFRPVQTGASDAQRVLVDKGITSGERVVANADGIKAGTRVQGNDAANR